MSSEIVPDHFIIYNFNAKDNTVLKEIENSDKIILLSSHANGKFMLVSGKETDISELVAKHEGWNYSNEVAYNLSTKG